MTASNEDTLDKGEIEGPVFDTRQAVKTKTIILILDNGTPEGNRVKFKIHPLNSDVYLNVLGLQDKIGALQKKYDSASSTKVQERQVKELAEELDKTIMPVVTPNKEFREWAKATLDEGAYMVYRTVMNTVIRLAMTTMKVEDEPTDE